MQLSFEARDKSVEMQSAYFNAKGVEGMELIERELNNALSDCEGTIRDMCSHILNAGGKRIRPLLVLYSGLAFSGQKDRLLAAAVAAELIHMASLVHDDIIDNSYLRRSRPSVNKIWGNHFAVLCGDYLFAKAFGILSQNRLIHAMEYMVQAISNMCHGEIFQAEARFNRNTGIQEYYRTITKKTALFLECCCRAGAATAQADEMQTEIIGEYGLHMGLAFQIIDDILDFSGDVSVMGKPVGEDFSQGNVTLPLILLIKDTEYGDRVKSYIKSKHIDKGCVEEVAMLMKRTGVMDKAFGFAAGHIERARENLKLLPCSDYTNFLYSLTESLKARMN